MIEEEIIGLFFAREEQAIRELDIKYGKVFYKTSYNILKNELDVEECVNDAYLGTWNTIPPTKPHSLLAYVCQIVRNLSLKCYYMKKSIKRNSTYDMAMEELDSCFSLISTVEDEIETANLLNSVYETKELAQMIEDFLDTLSLENRVIFLQRYWFSDTYSDIAKKVGISEKSVSVRLARIRKKMREYLMEREVFL